jgi:hypothetical protein
MFILKLIRQQEGLKLAKIDVINSPFYIKMTAVVMECWTSVAEVEKSGKNDQKTTFYYPYKWVLNILLYNDIHIIYSILLHWLYPNSTL